MAKHIHKCLSDGTYTIMDKCPSCGKQTIAPKPPKFSLYDKYAEMRREIRKKELQEKELY